MADRKGRLLVLDDDPSWREALQDLFARRGFTVRLTSSYDEALHALRYELFHVAIIDLRLVDWDEQDQSGMDLLRFVAQSDTALVINRYYFYRYGVSNLHYIRDGGYIVI